MKDPADDLRREMRKLIEPVADQVNALSSNLTNLTTRVDNAPGVYAEIVNIFDNSHPEYSYDAYTTLSITPDSAGDGNLEAYKLYRQLASDDTLSAINTNALKAAKTIEPADHSLWAANEALDLDIPRWDKVNGTIEMGGVTNLYDLVIPIANDIIFPGQEFFVQWEAMLRTSTPLPDTQVYTLFYDNTPGQRKVIEGGTFTITDENGNDPGVTYGIPGATSVNYKVIATTDGGEQAESNILNFPNAPAVFDGNNHPRVKFSGVPGFIKFEIYREIAGVYVLQYTIGNTIEGVYYDVGNPPQAAASAFPSITGTRPRAYARTTTFQAGSAIGVGWVRNATTILVPTTYDTSQTEPGMQFFRMGFTNPMVDARQVLIRKLGLSMGSGKWSRSPNDTRFNAHSVKSTTATGAGSGGGGPVDPPPGGGGGGQSDCVLLDTEMALIGDYGERYTKPLAEVEARRDRSDGGGPVCGVIERVRQAQTGRIFRIVTASGASIGCTPNHPFITNALDTNGTPASRLKYRLDQGETVEVLVRPPEAVFPHSERVISMTEEVGDFWVAIPMIAPGASPLIILNRFVCHNSKVAP